MPTRKGVRIEDLVFRARTTLYGRSVLLAYLVPSLLSVIAVQTWFEPGAAIAGGDLAPPVAPAADYTSHWSHLTAGEGSPTYDIVGLPYATWLDFWAWLGAGEEIAQRLWLSALFAGAAGAVVFLAFGFAESSVAAGSAGLLASFNAYRLVTGPDAVPMAAILVAALLGGLIARVAHRPERKTYAVGFAAASVGLAYVMANPPHVVLVLMWIAACVAISLFAQPAAARRTFGFLARAGALAVLLNVWWIVPAWLTISAPSFGDRFAAASVDEWAWTHERATLANALTLNTTWAWSHPEYFPYADRLDDPPFDVLKVFLPVLAVLGVVLARRRDRRIALGLAVTALAFVWLATGLRGPVPAVNRWLYDHAPGYWLFREPSKFLLLVLLPMSLLGGQAVNRLLNGPWRTRTPLLAAGLVTGALLYVHPLFTGEVIADERPPFPSAHVHVPDAWRQAAATLNAQPEGGKVLILPRADFYQVPTIWGYYGTPFARPMIRRPVLESYPGGYFRPVGGVSSFEESIESDLVGGRPADVGKQLSALGARFVLLRRDIDTDFPKRRFVRPDVLARSLGRVPGMRRLSSFGLLELYRLDGTAREVFAAAPSFYAGSSNALAPAMSVIPGTPGFVSKQDHQKLLARAGVRPAKVLRFEEEIVRRVAVKGQSGMLHVRLSDPFRLSFGGQTLPHLPPQRIVAPLPTNGPVVVRAGGSAFPLARVPRHWVDLGLVGLQRGQVLSVWRHVGARSLHPDSAGPVGDCNWFDNRPVHELGITRTVTGSAARPTLRLAARAHSACVQFPLVRGRVSDLYKLQFAYRQLRGSPPRACVWQSEVDRCAPAPDLRPSQRWQRFETTIRPHSRATALTLFLYADGQERAPITVAEYRGIRLDRYRRMADVPRTRAPMQVLPQRRSPQSILGFAPPVLSRPIDVASAGQVGDCNRYDTRTPAELGFARRIKGRSGSRVLQLAARDHSACVDFAISPIEPRVRAYRIRFAYRFLSGRSPRACLWQVGPERCASLPELGTSREWRVLDETVQLDPNVRELRLFLYADGGGDRTTVTEYRDLHVGPVGSVAIVGIPNREPLPRIVTTREAPWKVRVQVRNARAPFLLVTSEAYAPGWTASADGRDDSALRHVQVNGYANGWLVPWRGSYELTLEYEPERYARGARWLSVIAPLGVLGWMVRRRMRWFFYDSRH